MIRCEVGELRPALDGLSSPPWIELAGGDCDLVAPLSTLWGKGSWGRFEGVEPIFDLSAAAAAFVQHPLKHNQVQVRPVLDGLHVDAFLSSYCLGTECKQDYSHDLMAC